MIAIMKDDQGRKLLTCNEAAELYGCSMRYIRKLAAAGRVHSETVGRTYMVAEDDVKRLASRQDGGRLRKRSSGHKGG